MLLPSPSNTQSSILQLTVYQADIAVITETHLKDKHVDKTFLVCGYSLFHRDRVGSRGGGAVNYVSNRLLSDVWKCQGDLLQFVLLRVHVQARCHEIFVGATRLVSEIGVPLSIELDDNSDVQTNFNTRYSIMHNLLDCFYPACQTAIMSLSLSMSYTMSR
jgi:hypothetical protein